MRNAFVFVTVSNYFHYMILNVMTATLLKDGVDGVSSLDSSDSVVTL